MSIRVIDIRCLECGHVSEIIERDRGKGWCPVCTSNNYERLISTTAIKTQTSKNRYSNTTSPSVPSRQESTQENTE